MKERLLKRVRQWNNDDSASLKQIEGLEFVESVRLDIEQLLNTRRGTVLINDQMGLSDVTHLFNGFSIPDVDILQKNIMQQLKLFDARLSKISIVFIGDQSQKMQLIFQLMAQLQHEKNTIPFSVRVMLNENGSVDVTL